MSHQTSVSMKEIAKLKEAIAESKAREIVRLAVETFGDRLALASSFSAEDMVLVDMLADICPDPRIFVLDTGRLHQETYDLMALARVKYGIDFEVYFPDTVAVEELQRMKGPNSFYDSIENRKECCGIRKVEPLNRALSTVDAWMTGLRRGQSVTRADMGILEIDNDHGGIAKINPLLDWSDEDVWSYIKANGVPYNPLHDKGFPSIGCAPCTRAIQPGEDQRAGRWWWESPEHKECGLHKRR